MAKLTESEVVAFLDAPRIVDVVTLRAHGSPHVAPLWYEYAGGRFSFFTAATSVKTLNLERDPRIAISIASPDEPYTYVTADGIADVSRDDAVERAIRITKRYRGPAGEAWVRAFDWEVVIISFAPTRMHAWRADP